jgi:hypothetical protein
MYAAAFIGNKIIDLAGWDQGPGAETSNLSISYDSQFQSVSYVGGTWGRQFWRPGTMATVSFDSRFSFPDQLTTQFQRSIGHYLLTLQNRFINQQGMTFKLTVPNYLSMGTRQVETATGVGTIGTSGVIRYTITSADADLNPYILDDNVTSGETPAVCIQRAVDRLNRVNEISNYYTASRSGNDLILTRRSPYAGNDTTLNISIVQTSGTGVTNAPTSVNTTAGTSFSFWYENTFYDANISVAASQVGTSVLLNTSVTGRLTAP